LLKDRTLDVVKHHGQQGFLIADVAERGIDCFGCLDVVLGPRDVVFMQAQLGDLDVKFGGGMTHAKGRGKQSGALSSPMPYSDV